MSTSNLQKSIIQCITDAADLGDRRLCEECYRICGSCCPEFGADDLWPREDEG